MNPTRNALATLLHAALLTSSFLLLPSSAQAEVIPIIITNIVVQKIGPEAELEPLEEGLLYWRPADATTEAGLYYADGETPGGVAVCVGKADYHTLTNTLRCMGHAIELNAHYSLRAEGDSCLLRYGTNIVLRVDGNREAGSTNSLIKATVLAADNDGLTIQANALAADGATIEVTTDLMAVEAWTTATNAAVIESTDVTTTWRITYLDEPYQFYRVFAGGSTPHGTGITAERPFTASQGLSIPEGQGLTMGTNTWTDLPDMSAYAPSSAVASVRADLNSLSWRTTTNETAIDANAAAIAAAQGGVVTNAGNIASNAAALTAITNALGQRVSEFETVNIGYRPTAMTTNIWYVPTNLPTRFLDINVDASVYTASNTICRIYIPSNWIPSRPTTIRIFVNTARAQTRMAYGIGVTEKITYNPSSGFREMQWQWVSETGFWQPHYFTAPSGPAFYDTAGANKYGNFVLPQSVEAWIEWRGKQRW